MSEAQLIAANNTYEKIQALPPEEVKLSKDRIIQYLAAIPPEVMVEQGLD